MRMNSFPLPLSTCLSPALGAPAKPWLTWTCFLLMPGLSSGMCKGGGAPEHVQNASLQSWLLPSCQLWEGDDWRFPGIMADVQRTCVSSSGEKQLLCMELSSTEVPPL